MYEIPPLSCVEWILKFPLQRRTHHRQSSTSSQACTDWKAREDILEEDLTVLQPTEMEEEDVSPCERDVDEKSTDTLAVNTRTAIDECGTDSTVSATPEDTTTRKLPEEQAIS